MAARFAVLAAAAYVIAYEPIVPFFSVCYEHPLPCWSVFTEGPITHDGKLSACCFDHNGGFEMGDLTTTPFEEAWNSPTFRELRAAHFAEDVSGTPCESCVAYN